MSTFPTYDGTPASVIDLERYPIRRLDTPAAREIVDAGRAQFSDTGACVLPDFIRPAALEVAVEEARRLAPLGHRHAGEAPPYLEPPDTSRPEDHPRRMLTAYALAAVPYDAYPMDSPVRALYEWLPLMDFIAAVLNRGTVYQYADPLGALSMNVMGHGDGQGWHFDMSDFVVSLALQRSEAGGDFEVMSRIRTSEDERYDDVRRVLQGDEAGKLTLPMRPGTLVIFGGRHSLHRVTTIRGETLRLVALLAYDTKPGTNSSALLKLARYGREK